MRKLKHHENKLLKKVDFLQWKQDNNLREVQVMRRYHVQNREEYVQYNKICGLVRQLAAKLEKLPQQDPFRIKMTEKLIDELFDMGLIPNKKSLALATKLTVSSFCRRRLPVVLVHLKYAEHMREAVTFVEQGHIRVGPQVVNDPSFLVTRTFEDFITWVDGSKIKQKVMKYNDQLDDFDLLQ